MESSWHSFTFFKKTTKYSTSHFITYIEKFSPNCFTQIHGQAQNIVKNRWAEIMSQCKPLHDSEQGELGPSCFWAQKGHFLRQDAIPPCSWIKPALHIKLKLKAGPSIEGTEYASLRGLNTTNKKAFLEVHKPSPFQFSKPFNLTPTIANYVSWLYSEQHSFPLHNENKRYGDTSGCWERKDYVQVTTEQLVHRIFQESVVPCWLNKEQHGTSKANKCIVK